MKSDNKTPWEPLNLREKVSLAIIKFTLWVFRVDFFDIWRRQNVSWDELDEKYRIGMAPVNRLKEEWLEVYQTQSEFYDENENDEWVSYAMWLVMRSDEIINPPTILRGEKQDDGSWETKVNSKPPQKEKEARKEEILIRVDEAGFIDSVLPITEQNDNQTEN